MTAAGDAQLFLVKAEESLAGAESEYTSGRYNNCANRCYYACFRQQLPRSCKKEYTHPDRGDAKSAGATRMSRHKLPES